MPETVIYFDVNRFRCHFGTMAVATEKNSRLVARIPARIRKTIQQAADLEGASLNQFVVQAAHRQAREILERENTVRLNQEQTRRVFELLENPPEPNAAMLAAKAIHRKIFGA